MCLVVCPKPPWDRNNQRHRGLLSMRLGYLCHQTMHDFVKSALRKIQLLLMQHTHQWPGKNKALAKIVVTDDMPRGAVCMAYSEPTGWFLERCGLPHNVSAPHGKNWSNQSQREIKMKLRLGHWSQDQVAISTLVKRTSCWFSTLTSGPGKQETNFWQN